MGNKLRLCSNSIFPFSVNRSTFYLFIYIIKQEFVEEVPLLMLIKENQIKLCYKIVADYYYDLISTQCQLPIYSMQFKSFKLREVRKRSALLLTENGYMERTKGGKMGAKCDADVAKENTIDAENTYLLCPWPWQHTGQFIECSRLDSENWRRPCIWCCTGFRVIFSTRRFCNFAPAKTCAAEYYGSMVMASSNRYNIYSQSSLIEICGSENAGVTPYIFVFYWDPSILRFVW